MLDRQTPWRQGCVLAADDAVALGLYDQSSSESRRAVVVTHDCDLPNNKEECFEVIVGEVIEKPESQFRHAKNVRRLHLAFVTSDCSKRYLSLNITDKSSFSKTEISGEKKPDVEWILPDEEKRVLKQWLAARYGRPAFPNAFENHLRPVCKSTIEKQLAQALASGSQHLIGVFFDLGENRAVELPDGSPYVLKIILVYDVTEGGHTARIAAESVADQVRQLFEKAYGKPEVATAIALEACEAVADTQFSLADLRRVDQWRVEHISLSQTPQENFLPHGGGAG